MSEPIYPWQQSTWTMLLQHPDRLHHALLLSGEAGIGKQRFAQALAKSLLCQKLGVQAMPCEQCQSCHWFANDTHPDYQLICAESDVEDEEKKSSSKKKQITVHQIRALNDFLAISSHQGRKVILINPAEEMNLAASNALLKMLEEPPNNTFFILISHAIKRLLPTIRSRCQQVSMSQPDPGTAVAWLQQQGVNVNEQQLQYAGSSPLKALQMQEYDDCMSLIKSLMQGKSMDVAQAVSISQVLGMVSTVDVLQKCLHDLVFSKANIKLRYHHNDAEKFRKLSNQLELSKAFEFLDQLNDYRRHASHPLNQELQFESIYLKYIQLFKEAL